MLKRVLVGLLFLFCFWLIAFAVLGGSYVLASATADAAATTALGWVCTACLILLAITLVAMIAATSAAAVLGNERRGE